MWNAEGVGGSCRIGVRMSKVAVTALSTLVALCAAPAAGAYTVGVADDRGRDVPERTATFLDAMQDIGLTENRLAVIWDPDRPRTIPHKALLDAYVAESTARRINLMFAVYPGSARVLTDYPEAPGEFVDFLQIVARAYPGVKDYIIGNEPNQPRFWQPQFSQSGKPVACRQYTTVLARSYDALKAVSPSINVIGVGLSPRGNDNPEGLSNISTSPVRCIRDIGAAYRASRRQRPLMDEFSFHPYPERDTHPLSRGYTWPKAGLVNLDRIKQAIWDAFNGTAQPTFAEPSRSVVLPSLTFRLDETGWQVGVLPAHQRAYFGRENVDTTTEAAQAQVYAEAVRLMACDPSVRSMLLFGLIDEPDLDRWQAGLMRADWTRRPSYDTVKRAIAETGLRCTARPVTWTHATSVVGASWRPAVPRTKQGKTIWTFSAKVAEDTIYRSAVLRVRSKRRIPAKGLRAIGQLLKGNAPGILFKKGIVAAPFARVFRFQPRRMKPGYYVLATLLQAEMNTARTKVFVSRPFRVTGPPKPKPARKAKPKRKKR
jgi:hypothetical protein